MAHVKDAHTFNSPLPSLWLRECVYSSPFLPFLMAPNLCVALPTFPSPPEALAVCFEKKRR